MSPTARTPAEVIEVFAAALQAGRVDDLIALFEADAAFVPQPGAQPIVGLDAIRDSLTEFAKLRPAMTSDIRSVVVAGDVATVHNAWQLSGIGADGEPVAMAAVSADVVRRRADGTWGILIDNPWGA